MVIVLCVRRSIIYHEQRYFVLYNVYSHKNGMGSDDCYWGDVKMIIYEKISTISISMAEKQNIVYTSTYIESFRIKRDHYE